MTNQIPDRARIFSHMTRTRFLHIEDALQPAEEGKPGKIRFFIGAYTAGSGTPATTAHHFLDDDEARVIMTDLSWGKPVDITDYKGTVGNGGPQSRVLKIKGPTDKGKYWLQVSMGPGEVIGQGAVKPAGKPEVEVSIPLTTWEARKLALAVIEYMTAYRVTQLLVVNFGRADEMLSRPQARRVDTETGEINPLADEIVRVMTTPAQDCEDLFGEDRELADFIGDEVGPEPPADDTPATFYQVAPAAIQAGLLDLVNQLVQGPGSWSQKAQRLQAAMV